MTHYWPSTLPGRLQAHFNEIWSNKKTNSKDSSVRLMRISMSVVGVQVVLGTEGLPWAFFWRQFHCGPLISVCNLPNLWTHSALLSLPSHWKALHWVLWEPNEDSEKRLQVSVTTSKDLIAEYLSSVVFLQDTRISASYEELFPAGSWGHHVWLLHSHFWQSAREGKLAAALFS